MRDQGYKTSTLSRLEKGFRFELEVCRGIERNIKYDSFQHNPLEYSEWLHNIGKGCDCVLVVRGIVFNIECKFLDTNRVYPSYIWRDYIPRFKGRSGVYVVVTNNKWNIPYNCRELLRSHGILVWELSELVWNIMMLTSRSLNTILLQRTFVRAEGLRISVPGLRKLKQKSGLGLGHGLKVVWMPGGSGERSGEVKGAIIYVYEEGPEKALEALRQSLSRL